MSEEAARDAIRAWIARQTSLSTKDVEQLWRLIDNVVKKAVEAANLAADEAERPGR